MKIDTTRAAKAGFTPEQITQQLSAGMLGHVATEVRRGDRLVDLRVRYPDKYRFDPAWVRNFPLTSEAGAVVPLQATAEAQLTEGSAQLYREDLKQMLPISARLEGRDLGSAIADVRAMLEAEHLPVGYTWQIGGQYESQQNSFRSLLVVAALALLLVFGLLVAQFRGFSSAMVIVSAAPLSLVGAFGLLLVTHTPLNVSSFMGLILLIGLIVKNGIILVDHAHVLSERGVDWRDALVRAGGVRLRPILMTTLCTLFGLLPLALGLGPGAEMQRPLAIAVIGGLTVSTLVTLVFVPVVMSMLGRGGGALRWSRRRWASTDRCSLGLGTVAGCGGTETPVPGTDAKLAKLVRPDDQDGSDLPLLSSAASTFLASVFGVCACALPSLPVHCRLENDDVVRTSSPARRIDDDVMLVAREWCPRRRSAAPRRSPLPVS